MPFSVSYFITGIEEFSERLAPSCLSESIGVFKEADVHDLLLNYYVLSRDFKQLSFSWFFAETKYWHGTCYSHFSGGLPNCRFPARKVSSLPHKYVRVVTPSPKNENKIGQSNLSNTSWLKKPSPDQKEHLRFRFSLEHLLTETIPKFLRDLRHNTQTRELGTSIRFNWQSQGKNSYSDWENKLKDEHCRSPLCFQWRLASSSSSAENCSKSSNRPREWPESWQWDGEKERKEARE